MDIRDLLNRVAQGALSPGEASELLEQGGIKDLDFARVDLGRRRRCGMPEVIYCEGKEPDQVVAIMAAMQEAGQNVLATRVGAAVQSRVAASFPDAVHHAAARCITLAVQPAEAPVGCVAVVSAGTSDIPVAEEAAITSECMGARVERVYDVGVAGLHRLMSKLGVLRASRAVIVVAGMEGALPSVVGGLIDRPLLAVPTSIGYGAHLNGLAPLLTMLNSCAPGIAVVNIDNGFGAGAAAALINRVGEPEATA